MPRIAQEVEPGPRAMHAPTRTAWLLARVVASILALGGSWLALGACGETASSATVGLVEAIAPHEEAIERYSLWALRSGVTGSSRDRARLEETLFAPIRDDERFVAVIVEREGHAPVHLVHPPDAVVPDLTWSEVRCRRLGLVDAARDPGEPSQLWVRVRAGGEEGLVITVGLQPQAN